MRRRLKAKHPWFDALMSPTPDLDRTERFMAGNTLVDGVPVQVEEMTGQPGDVFIMHPGALHAIAPNARREPRLALTQFVYPKCFFA